MSSFRPFIRPSVGLLFLAGAAALSAQTTPPGEAAPEAISLPALVGEIVAKNPERQFYQDELAVAKAGQRYSATWSDPELSFDLGRKRVKDAGGGLLGEGNAWSVSVTQTFEWPGRLALRKAIANRDVELAELGVARFENALVARARSLAYGLHASHAKAEAVREVAERFTALKQTFLARDPAGITPLLETRVIEAAELALQRRATEAELAVQADLIELNQLRGAAPDAALKIATPALTFKDAPETVALVAAARENNFEFRLRRVELEQQGYAVRLARNERYPAISVSPFFSQEKAGDRETTIGVGFSLPIPVTGRTRGVVDVAEARRRQAETAVFVAQRELDREILTAALAFQTKLAEARRWSPDSASKFREAAELADRHYRLGAVPIGTYVEMQHAYLEAVEALLDTRREALEAGFRLQLLTGLDFNVVQISQP
jgi:cobalt-zinc-cadmium efflux system outer membrane protein